MLMGFSQSEENMMEILEATGVSVLGPTASPHSLQATVEESKGVTQAFGVLCLWHVDACSM